MSYALRDALYNSVKRCIKYYYFAIGLINQSKTTLLPLRQFRPETPWTIYYGEKGRGYIAVDEVCISHVILCIHKNRVKEKDESGTIIFANRRKKSGKRNMDIKIKIRSYYDQLRSLL